MFACRKKAIFTLSLAAASSLVACGPTREEKMATQIAIERRYDEEAARLAREKCQRFFRSTNESDCTAQLIAGYFHSKKPSRPFSNMDRVNKGPVPSSSAWDAINQIQRTLCWQAIAQTDYENGVTNHCRSKPGAAPRARTPGNSRSCADAIASGNANNIQLRCD